MDAREYGDDLTRRLLESARAAVPDCIGVGISAVVEGSARSVGAVGVAADLDPLQWRLGEGPVCDALAAEIPLDHRAGEDAARWPRLADEPAWRRVRGCLTAGGTWTEDTSSVVSLYLDTPATAMHAAALDRYEAVLSQVAAMVEYCVGQEMESWHLLEMTRHRRIIEQAKGILVALTRQPAEECFAQLVRISQRDNVKLRDLAAGLVAELGGQPPLTSEGVAAQVPPRAAEAAQRLARAVTGSG